MPLNASTCHVCMHADLPVIRTLHLLSSVHSQSFSFTYYVIIRSCSQETSKCDDRCQTSEVHEEKGSHTLHMHGVFEVADIPWYLPSDIPYQPSKQPVIPQSKRFRTNSDLCGSQATISSSMLSAVHTLLTTIGDTN